MQRQHLPGGDSSVSNDGRGLKRKWMRRLADAGVDSSVSNDGRGLKLLTP